MPTKIQLRRDTAADWASNNPTLSAGEFGWESDTNRFKIGTGSTAWNSLDYSDTLKTLGDLGVTGSTISAPSNGDLTLTTSGSGKVNISNAYTLPSSDGSANQVLQTNGSGVLSFGTVSVGDFSFVGSTMSSPSNADITLSPSGSGKVNISGAYTLPSSDGSANQVLQTDGAGNLSFGTVSIGDLSIVGSTIGSPSNADLTLTSSGGNVVIEGIRVAGTTISTEDSSAGVQVAGNLIPSADGVFQLGSSSRRWSTAFLSAETLDIGGATISSDGTGSIAIAATGATLPTGSKVVDQAIVLGGKTDKTTARPVQIVKVFVSDGSSNFTDAQLLAKTADLELEFNGTVETVPVYTEASQTFTLADGTSLSNNAAGITLFQF